MASDRHAWAEYLSRANTCGVRQRGLAALLREQVDHMFYEYLCVSQDAAASEWEQRVVSRFVGAFRAASLRPAGHSSMETDDLVFRRLNGVIHSKQFDESEERECPDWTPVPYPAGVDHFLESVREGLHTFRPAESVRAAEPSLREALAVLDRNPRKLGVILRRMAAFRTGSAAAATRRDALVAFLQRESGGAAGPSHAAPPAPAPVAPPPRPVPARPPRAPPPVPRPSTAPPARPARPSAPVPVPVAAPRASPPQMRSVFYQSAMEAARDEEILENIMKLSLEDM